MSPTREAAGKMSVREKQLEVQPNAPSWPQPCEANTAVVNRPRVRVGANSDVMTALRG